MACHKVVQLTEILLTVTNKQKLINSALSYITHSHNTTPHTVQIAQCTAHMKTREECNYL